MISLERALRPIHQSLALSGARTRADRGFYPSGDIEPLELGIPEGTALARPSHPTSKCSRVTILHSSPSIAKATRTAPSGHTKAMSHTCNRSPGSLIRRSSLSSVIPSVRANASQIPNSQSHMPKSVAHCAEVG